MANPAYRGGKRDEALGESNKGVVPTLSFYCFEIACGQRARQFSDRAMKKITTIEQLEDVYGIPMEVALRKEIDFISDDYRRFIEVSPFLKRTIY